MLKNWLNPQLIDKDEIKNLNIEFNSNYPFEHLSINDFLLDFKAKELREAIQNLEFYEEDNDLYKFNRTVDFKNLENSVIKKFREFFLSLDFIDFIEKITGVLVDKNKVDLHSLKLTNTNYLLCHDDRVENRKVAFILNLSENWKEEFGGNLEFFETNEKNLPVKVSKSIIPSFNQFNIFLVSDKSFHQISEVLTDKERLSISGWYYVAIGDR